MGDEVGVHTTFAATVGVSTGGQDADGDKCRVNSAPVFTRRLLPARAAPVFVRQALALPMLRLRAETRIDDVMLGRNPQFAFLGQMPAAILGPNAIVRWEPIPEATTVVPLAGHVDAQAGKVAGRQGVGGVVGNPGGIAAWLGRGRQGLFAGDRLAGAAKVAHGGVSGALCSSHTFILTPARLNASTNLPRAGGF